MGHAHTHGIFIKCVMWSCYVQPNNHILFMTLGKLCLQIIHILTHLSVLTANF
ncbi:hypothetical protein [Moraxella lacunata]|uniref:hypothetical protein n=1 Tax=Moraxella lacunata TaxID=477 RepID=UPI003EE33B86